jgi:ABC-2 type transport system ATP-binding protein
LEDKHILSVIEVSNLTKTYGEVLAVDRISFEIRTGEIFGLLGPNGAGKTTTLECMEGLHEPNGGSIQAAGMDSRIGLHRLSKCRIRKTGKI